MAFWAFTKGSWRSIARRGFKALGDDRISLTAAGVAFYAILSIFPGMAALISLWGLAADRGDVVQQLMFFGRLLPADALQVLSQQAQQIAAADPKTIGLTFLVSLGISLFSASAAIRAIMEALNIVFRQPERRGFFRFQLTAIAITCVLSVGVLAALGAVVIVPIALNFIGLSGQFEMLIDVVRWPILFLGAWAGIAALYRVAPSRPHSQWRWIAPSAGAAVVVWLVASVVLSIYLRHFAHYNETYGSLGAVIGLMMWFWLSAFALLLGAEIGGQMEAESKRLAKGEESAAAP
jgi:membrane protein